MLLLTACAMDRRTDIPANASVASSGDDRLTYTPATDGTIWVVEAPHDTMVYSGLVRANASVVVDPKDNVITVDGRTVYDKGLTQDTMHRIYFQSGEISAASGS